MIPAENPPSDPKQGLKAIQILFIALVTGLVIFHIIVIAWLLISGPTIKQADPVFDKGALAFAFIVAAIALYAAFNQYKKRILEIKNSDNSLDDKLNQYRSILILYLALCEGPGLLAVILLFLTGNYLLLIASTAMILGMFAKAPLLKRIVNDLGLDWNQQQELQ